MRVKELNRKTEVLSAHVPEERERAARILRAGGLVALPTETVYGLAADALDQNAARRIFEAKGRPSDNPLIVHIGDLAELNRLCRDIPEDAYRLALAFWPGPLTLVLPRLALVPDAVCAGLSTVAVRMPAHPAFLDVLRASGLMLAAPSANRSGGPSPTTARHVLDDLTGRIDAVLDGGPCEWGVESTVLDMTAAPYRVLRPGGITAAELSEALGAPVLSTSDKGTDSRTDHQTPRAPGMKYRHYAPETRLVLLDGPVSQALSRLRSASPGGRVLCCEEEKDVFAAYAPETYGRSDDPRGLMRGLYTVLRRLDDAGAPVWYVRLPERRDGPYEAVVNRLTKASADDTPPDEKNG